MRKILMVIAIAFSMTAMSTFSTVAVAKEDAEGARQATVETLKVVEKGIKETKEGSSAQEIKVYYFEARQEIKDINGVFIERDLQSANDALFAVSRSLKLDNVNRPLTAEEQAVTLAAWEQALKILKIIQDKQH